MEEMSTSSMVIVFIGSLGNVSSEMVVVCFCGIVLSLFSLLSKGPNILCQSVSSSKSSGKNSMLDMGSSFVAGSSSSSR